MNICIKECSGACPGVAPQSVCESWTMWAPEGALSARPSAGSAAGIKWKTTGALSCLEGDLLLQHWCILGNCKKPQPFRF